MARAVFHVTPYVNGWQVKCENHDEREVLVDNKDNALGHAKDLAKKYDLAQVIVHTGDGKIAEEFTYGQDPPQTKG